MAASPSSNPRTMALLSAAVALMGFAVSVFLAQNPDVPPALQPIVNVLTQSKVFGEVTSDPARARSRYHASNAADDGLLGVHRPATNDVDVKFTLHWNGDGKSAGVPLQTKDFPKGVDQVIQAHCCTLGNMTAERCAPNSGARLIGDNGVRVWSFADIENEQRVYCVPQGVHFVWPLAKVGDIVYPKNVVGPVPGKPIRLRQLSEQPRVFAVDNFVSPEEVEELLRANKNRMTPSEVGFGGWQDDTRTSSTSWDFSSRSATRIQKRTFEVLGMDYQPDLADAMQVLQYLPHDPAREGRGQWYKPHVDWFSADGYDGNDPKVENGTNRFATMFLYLSDVEQGGSTVFPLSTTHEGYNGEKLVHDGTVDTPGYINTKEAYYCCNETSTALRSKPKQGNAVLFYSQGPDGTLDPYSLHGGCPPIKGIKHSANVWIWNRQRPDKSKAKDLPKAELSKKEAAEGKFTVSFHNPPSSGRTYTVYWDSATPNDLSLEDYDAVYAEQVRDKTQRLVPQFDMEAGATRTMGTYPKHVFVFYDASNHKFAWAKSMVKGSAKVQQDEDGELIVIGS